MSTELIYSDATKLAELIRTREISPVEVMQAHLDRIEAVNPKLNAIVTLADGALKSAKEAEAAVLRGDELGPLHGVPFTVKDSIDTAKVLTQRGSPIFMRCSAPGSGSPSGWGRASRCRSQRSRIISICSGNTVRFPISRWCISRI